MPILQPCGCPHGIHAFRCFIYRAMFPVIPDALNQPISPFIACGGTLAYPFPLNKVNRFSPALAQSGHLLSCGVRLMLWAIKKASYNWVRWWFPYIGGETDSCVTGFYSLTTTSTVANLRVRGGLCQSSGVKKVQRIHATIVKSITPIPINIPAHKIVNKLAIILPPCRIKHCFKWNSYKQSIFII